MTPAEAFGPGIHSGIHMANACHSARTAAGTRHRAAAYSYKSSFASEEVGMSPGAFVVEWLHDHRRGHDGVVWPSVVAILFAALAVASFAVDHSVTLSTLPGSGGA
jgi:hypothetical protein